MDRVLGIVTLLTKHARIWIFVYPQFPGITQALSGYTQAYSEGSKTCMQPVTAGLE